MTYSLLNDGGWGNFTSVWQIFVHVHHFLYLFYYENTLKHVCCNKNIKFSRKSERNINTSHFFCLFVYFQASFHDTRPNKTDDTDKITSLKMFKYS